MPQEQLTLEFFRNGVASQKIEAPGDFARIIDGWMRIRPSDTRAKGQFVQLRYDDRPLIDEIVVLANEAAGAKLKLLLFSARDRPGRWVRLTAFVFANIDRTDPLGRRGLAPLSFSSTLSASSCHIAICSMMFLKTRRRFCSARLSRCGPTGKCAAVFALGGRNHLCTAGDAFQQVAFLLTLAVDDSLFRLAKH